MFLIFAIILALYALFVISCITSWIRYKPQVNESASVEPSLSLVVCCKNEATALPRLLSSIAVQIDDIDEIVFASDHSTDSTFDILQEFAVKHGNIKVFQTDGYGKKNALREAIARSTSQYILCTDADCVLGRHYFELVRRRLSTDQVDLMIGGVKYIDNHTLFGRLQALEFSSLAATTMCSALGKFPIMCNGANLAFSRRIWDKAQNRLVDTEASGDDIFLLHYIKEIKGSVVYFKDIYGFVETLAADTLHAFYNQRKRWTSKSRSYTDAQTVFVALLVTLTSITMAASMIAAIFDSKFILLWLIKLVIDSALLIPFLLFSQQKYLIAYIPFLSVIYPFYIIMTVLGGLFGKFRWK